MSLNDIFLNVILRGYIIFNQKYNVLKNFYSLVSRFIWFTNESISN